MSEWSIPLSGSDDHAVMQDQLRDLLAHLHELAVIETHPLTLRLAGGLPPANDATAVRIRALLSDAIERLKPANEAASHTSEWRQYVILRDRYVLRRPLREIEDKLALGERQMRREHQQAVASLAVLLAPFMDQPQRAPLNAALPAPESGQTSASLAEAVQRLSPAPRVFGLGQLLQDIVWAGEQASRALPTDARPVLNAKVEPHDLSVFTDRGILHQLLLKLTQFLLQFSARGGHIQYAGRWLEHADAGSGAGSQVLLQVIGQVTTETPHHHDTLRLCMLLAESLQSALHVSEQEGMLSASLSLPAGERLRKVLIVDDELPAAELFQSYLVGLNYETVVETKPEHAVQRALEIKPDVIVLDVMMPAMDGWELLQRFRHTPGVADVPVIACSVINDADMATVLGATLFLRKPVLRGHLVGALEDAFGNRQRA
jgi:CheY-like chemotaxis protein